VEVQGEPAEDGNVPTMQSVEDDLLDISFHLEAAQTPQWQPNPMSPYPQLAQAPILPVAANNPFGSAVTTGPTPTHYPPHQSRWTAMQQRVRNPFGGLGAGQGPSMGLGTMPPLHLGQTQQGAPSERQPQDESPRTKQQRLKGAMVHLKQKHAGPNWSQPMASAQHHGMPAMAPHGRPYPEQPATMAPHGRSHPEQPAAMAAQLPPPQHNQRKPQRERSHTTQEWQQNTAGRQAAPPAHAQGKPQCERSHSSRGRQRDRELSRVTMELQSTGESGTSSPRALPPQMASNTGESWMHPGAGAPAFEPEHDWVDVERRGFGHEADGWAEK